jgi:hypothetical protein
LEVEFVGLEGISLCNGMKLFGCPFSSSGCCCVAWEATMLEVKMSSFSLLAVSFSSDWLTSHLAIDGFIWTCTGGKQVSSRRLVSEITTPAACRCRQDVKMIVDYLPMASPVVHLTAWGGTCKGAPRLGSVNSSNPWVA